MRRELVFHALTEGRGVTARLLDVGSGQGEFPAKAMVAGFATAYAGFEWSKSGVRIARRKLPLAQILPVDLFNPAPASAAFEAWATAAVCSDVIEHVDEPVEFLRRLGRCLAPGARLVLTVPGGPTSAFDRHFGHRMHYSGQSVRQTLEEAGFTVGKIWRAGFPFFNLYRSLVISRGRRLIADVEGGDDNRAASFLARITMSAFGFSFRLNLRNSAFGWQVVAIATKT
jgi:SAM-dependent methyltransferase